MGKASDLMGNVAFMAVIVIVTRLIERTLSKAHKMSFVAYFGPKRREGNKTTKVNLSAGRKRCAKASVRLFFLVNWAH
jgi:hypothetical protein